MEMSIVLPRENEYNILTAIESIYVCMQCWWVFTFTVSVVPVMVEKNSTKRYLIDNLILDDMDFRQPIEFSRVFSF